MKPFKSFGDLILWSAAYVDALKTLDSVRAAKRATEVVSGLRDAVPSIVAEYGSVSDEAKVLSLIFDLPPLSMLMREPEPFGEEDISAAIAKRVLKGCEQTGAFIARAKLAQKWWCVAHARSESDFWARLLSHINNPHESADETLRRFAQGFRDDVGIHKGTSENEIRELTFCATQAIASFVFASSCARPIPMSDAALEALVEMRRRLEGLE